MSRMVPMAVACPCGQPQAYEACCGRFHAAWARGDHAAMAPGPEALMRSRYTAFVYDLRPYLLATWHPDTRPAEIEPPEPGLRWLGLTVQRVGSTGGGDEGTVAFVARYKIGGRAHRLVEHSRFVRESGIWLYVAALDGAVPVS
ncbi:YchJ family protein [Aquabacterium fontiphilum]|uniref:YchJ family protein n=1 Tax=Aquabacterium fontiphilum TaxID=450365 RepID=UPI001F3C674A|nr:YchJ family metal-binding protein [Aquabacterium fontiphilum]